MKKLLRILFILVLTSIFILGIVILYTEIAGHDIAYKLESDPSLLIPLFYTLVCIPSIIFNVKKFTASFDRSTGFYKIIRISDLVFAVSSFLLSGAAVVMLIKNNLFFNQTGVGSEFFIIRDIIFLLLFVISILLFIDNLKVHKTPLEKVALDSIDDIGGS
ncbi:hypothetical protein AAON49_11455 [Pseudotenacibaculum sp. MALMAid0570]|uniref:hypothetical protein n=1 Tax=Pseudotenacibaculum sp. MALMAid0570 TaxID=3143938 RepID=UPI0032DE6063